MTVELTGGDYRVRIDPAHGGAILSAEWTRPDGAVIRLLTPLNEPTNGFKAGCFAMLPFANRIDKGRFTFSQQEFVLPINLPAEDMAIHGFSRDNPWAVMREETEELILAQEFERDDNPYRYAAQQKLSLSDDGIRIELSIRNDGSSAMPFGMGLHPWFVKTRKCTLTFEADGNFERDARGLPTLPIRDVSAFDPACPVALGDLPWFDGCFTDWRERRAQLAWPELGTALSIEADGAMRHLHVYVPDDRDVVCAEPVSHAPDAINRSEIGAAMDILGPGQALTGSMTLRAMLHSNFEVSP
jgi:aldose 1-epimerase